MVINKKLTSDTIFAQISRPGRAGISAFRISGPSSIFAITKLINVKEDEKLAPRLMALRKLYDPITKDLIDHAMVVYFQGPASFTGEDSIEIYTHGSNAIAVMLTKALLSVGLRLAQAGEFTKRAFINGKFDLTAAEGIADLIEAETLWQHRQAIKQAEGELGKLYASWRGKLLNIMSLLEAYIDFPDEQIPDNVLEHVETVVENLKNTIKTHLDDKRRGELLRNGIMLAILGKPNVGKSSLLNFLVQRDLAIVSDIPGTTRDIIEGHIDINGYPVILQDTAGIRSDIVDSVEKEGIKRALNSAKDADIKIILLDSRDTKLSPEFEELIDNNTIIVVNKIDLYEPKSKENVLKISIKNKKGLEELLDKIANLASALVGTCEEPQITQERHRNQIKLALGSLSNFNLNEDLVLAAEDIRMAIRYLSILTGKIDIEEILDEIFSNFCIGK